MKYVIIGDIHGRTSWEKIIAKEDFDKIVFLGDYFDPYENFNNKQLIDNFNKIIDFKLKYPDKVITLVGNHDSSYLVESTVKSRFRQKVFDLIHDKMIYLVEHDILQLCHNIPYTSIMFSHAGFTKTWLNDFNLIFDEKILNEHYKNSVLNSSYNMYEFRIDGHTFPNLYGDDIYQGPLWIRPHSLNIDKIPNIIQIVGHTQNNWVTDIKLNMINLCDSLAFNKYYTLELCQLDYYFNQKEII